METQPGDERASKAAQPPLGWGDVLRVPPDAPGGRLLELSPRAQDALKIVALATMLVDHVGWVFFPSGADWMHWVGRLAFPLFCLLLAYNLERRAVPLSRYLLPLAALALASQLPYALALGSIAPGRGNIFFTLLFGVVAWRLLRAGPVGALLCLPLFLASGWVDYGAVGVALLPAAALVVRGPVALALPVWVIVALAANRFAPMAIVGALAPLFAAGVGSLLGGRRLLAGRAGRLVGWWFYPLHLAVLGLLARL